MKIVQATRHTHIKRLDDVVVLKPHGDLTGGEETDELESLIDAADHEGVRCLVVNLAAVGWMNAIAIARLVGGHLKFEKRKARMVLCNLETKLESVFAITKLTLEMDVYATEEDAIAGFASASS